MISDDVPTLDRCQRLKELEMPQETEFSWYRRRWSPMSAWESRILRAAEAVRDSVRGHEVELLCAAPLATEILRRLSETVDTASGSHTLMMRKYKGLFTVNYVGKMGYLSPDNTMSESLPNALADLLIWCIEQGHVTWEKGTSTAAMP